MSGVTDPAREVLNALAELRNVIHANDWCTNAGLRGDEAEIRRAWNKFETALVNAAAMMREPKPGRGITAIWLLAVCQKAETIEKSLNEWRGGWREILFQDHEGLIHLVINLWPVSHRALNFGQCQTGRISALLKEVKPPLDRLLELAQEWSDEFPDRTGSGSDSEQSSHEWRCRRDELVREAGDLVLQAVNECCVAPEVVISDKFRIEILRNLDTPSALVWPFLVEESNTCLFDLVSFLKNEPIEIAANAAPTISEGNQGASGETIDVPTSGQKTIDAQSPSGQLKLYGPENDILLGNLPHPKITIGQYNVVKALCLAGRDGLSKDELPNRSGQPGALGILRYLLNKKDPRWQSAIQMAGVSGGRYRLV